MSEKTIAAVATALSNSGIAIIRVSGNEAVDIADKIFVAHSGKKLSECVSHTINYGYVTDMSGNTIDEVLVSVMKGPHSYTGEDIIEFQVHGGTILTQKILSALIENGAQMAEPGEFTKRAFENGKVSLDEAESIIGEITAESESELKASLNHTSGKLKQKITTLQNNLTESIAQIEATLDYPEEDFEKSVKENIFLNIKNIKSTIDEFIEDSKNARFISKGINIAIVGSPNVGKSSLLNALIGQDRAIVTDIKGTTRDTLNESIFYKGIKLNFIDTAGIRESDDSVEKIGIEKSRQAIENADVVLFVLDGSEDMSEEDKQLQLHLSGYKNAITIINKSDKARKLEKQNNEICVSALKEENITLVKEKIYSLVINEEIDYNKTIITNERQLSILNECENIINQILSSQDESMDIVAMLIKSLWNELGKITGQSENEAIIDLIFSKFCLGK